MNEADFEERAIASRQEWQDEVLRTRAAAYGAALKAIRQKIATATHGVGGLAMSIDEICRNALDEKE